MAPPNTKMNWMVGIALILVSVVYIGGKAGFITAPLSVAEQAIVEGVEAADASFCGGGETQSLIISGVSIDDLTSSNTESTNLLRKIGSVSWTAWTLGTAITSLEVGRDYEFVIGTGLTDHTGNAHGPHFTIDNMPCRESFTLPVYTDEDSSGTTFTWYNADDNAAYEGFSANEVQTVSFKVKAASNEYFGNPTLVSLDSRYLDLQTSMNAQGTEITFLTPSDTTPNVCYYTLNTTEWDKPDQIYLADGTELSSTTCPTRLAVTAGSKTYCYAAPLINDKQMRIYSDLDTDDTVAPGTDDTFGCFAAAYYVDGKTGDLEYGVEDEDDNAVGGSAETGTIDNTA